MGRTLHLIWNLRIVFGRSVSLRVGAWLVIPLITSATFGARAVAWPLEVERALAHAGKNRGELERVLRHFQGSDDPLKYAAACFLIRNMPEHVHAVFALKDSRGSIIPFDALRYPDYAQARRGLSELAAKHGALDFRAHQVIRDLETVTADYLIEDIELAFRTWREKPWAQSLSFDAFCEYVLPYRARNEPVEHWRAACEVPTADIVAEMKDPSDPREAAALVMKHTKHRMGFDELYYLRPTAQGFSEMCRRGVGRCEDISNLQIYVYRANGIAVAGDYTPFWAKRDNNHSWDVVVDKDGRGSAKLINTAAKVYRTQFSHNRESLRYRVDNGDGLPPALGSTNFSDVTDQYIPTTDVAVQLVFSPPRPASIAYLCVFNAGAWRPIHWAPIADSRATFTRMGRGIAYLPAYYQHNHIVPAAPPFILDEDGQTQQLAVHSDDIARFSLTRAALAPSDTSHNSPTSGTTANADERPQLYVWDRGWQLLGRLPVDQAVKELWRELPDGRMYWVVSTADRATARIFTIEGGQQRFW